MRALPKIREKDELISLVNEIGFLPLFECGLRGFSVEAVTSGSSWWDERDPAHDPWEWRNPIAQEGVLCYAKVFGGKAGFISREWYPFFANFRRDGYDFDSLWEEGLAPARPKRIMDLFPGEEILSKHEIKNGAGIEKGFEGALTWLQMQTYLTVRGFRRRINAKGAGYGWPVALYSTAEALLGGDLVRSAYGEEPEISGKRIFDRCAQYNPQAFDENIIKFIK